MNRIATTVDEYVAYLGIEKGMSPNTVLAYRRDLDQYHAFLQAHALTDPDDISRREVLDFVAFLRSAGHTSASVERKLSAVKMFHAFAYKEGLTGHNPATKLPRMKRAQLLPDVLSLAQIESMLVVLQQDATPEGLRNRALFEVLYGCGVRASELCKLDIDDIDFKGGTLRVTGKGSKQRITPLGAPAADILHAYLSGGRAQLHTKRSLPAISPAVFLTTRGKRMYREGVYRVVRKVGRRAGIEGVHPHTFRHSYATHMLEGGADLRSLQEMLGHADLGTTQIYTHVDQSHLKQEYLLSHPRARKQ